MTARERLAGARARLDQHDALVREINTSMDARAELGERLIQEHLQHEREAALAELDAIQDELATEPRTKGTTHGRSR